MKAEDLMIGDLVKFPHGIDKVCDLPYIEGKGICASFAASATLFPVPVEALEPIPLTVEMLEEMGWIYYPAYEEYHKSGVPFIITYYFNKYPLRAKGWIALHYVHQLQQVGRLCKVDLEIKI